MANPVCLSLLLAIASAVISGLKWNSAPHKVPIWWNLEGHPMAWAPKWLGLFGLPVLELLIPYIVYQFASRDPAIQNQGGESKAAAAHVICLPAMFLFFVHIFLVLDSATSVQHDFHPRVFVASIALWLLCWYGYNIQYIEMNSTIGILTPWTVTNATNWNRTQSHAGFVLVLAGFILLVVSLACPLGTGLLVTTLVLWLGPFVYLMLFSYCISSGESDRLLP